MPEHKLHWFSLYFNKHDKMPNNSLNLFQGNRYIGSINKQVTLKDIKDAANSEGMPEKPILASVSYLGYMTESEFRGETEDGTS